MRTEYFAEKRKKNERVCQRDERKMEGEIDREVQDLVHIYFY